MKLEAKSRLQSLVTAAPVSVAEQERFIDALRKLDPALALGSYSVSFGEKDRTKLFVKGKPAGLLAIRALSKHGWQHDGSWNKFSPQDFPTLTKNGEWPINVQINPLGVTFHAPTNDNAGDDSAFKNALTKMAKAVMPGKADLDLSQGTAEWRKRGGHAGGNIIQTVLQKAKAAGFKPASSFSGAHPAGDWVSSDETYLHPEGWILTFGSSYGVTKRDNSFWVRLGVDYRRGEDKEALAKLPQPGTKVRYRHKDSTSDNIGVVREVRNTRLLVNRGSGTEWVEVDSLKPIPKSGDQVTFRNPRLGKELEGTIKEVGPEYAVVNLSGGYSGTDYIYYVNILTVNGVKWDWKD